MNDNNEVNIGKHDKKTLLDLICAKVGVADFSKEHVQILIDNHFILIRDEVIIINPYFAQYTRNRKFTNVTWEEIDELRKFIF